MLHQCNTRYMGLRVRKIAHKLGDAKLLFKLSEGDMVAAKAMYHSNCLKVACRVQI